MPAATVTMLVQQLALLTLVLLAAAAAAHSAASQGAALSSHQIYGWSCHRSAYARANKRAHQIIHVAQLLHNFVFASQAMQDCLWLSTCAVGTARRLLQTRCCRVSTCVLQTVAPFLLTHVLWLVHHRSCR